MNLPKQYANKLNDVTATAKNRNRAWLRIRKKCENQGLKKPLISQIYEL